MGTPASFRVIEKGIDSGKQWTRKFVLIYTQYDGYPENIGSDVAKYLEDSKVVNGCSAKPLTFKENGITIFNGTDCLAAQLVKKLKTRTGGIYVQPMNERGKNGEHFTYDIIVDDETKNITMVAYAVENKIKKIFTGTPTEFLEKYHND